MTARFGPAAKWIAIGLLALLVVGAKGYDASRARRLRDEATPAPRPKPSATAFASARPVSPASRPRARLAPVVIHPVVHPKSASSSEKTAERVAADALHSGDHPKAAALYRALASACPENHAFADAARILGR